MLKINSYDKTKVFRFTEKYDTNGGIIMDYEKKYKEALERARMINNGEDVDTEAGTTTCEYIFPELAESEDERIRNLIYCLIRDRSDIGKLLENNGCSVEKALAWLEKQSEQKSVHKVEPKFHEGDWVIDKQGIVHQIAAVIENVTNHTYGYDIVGGGYFNDNTEGVRLWTIQDAKDGDVLVDVYGNISIYEKCDDFDWMAYCSLGHNGGFQHFKIEHENEKTYPATKEQRDLLFQKVKEAGYEWDEEKKELRKIEQKPIEKVNGEDYGIDGLWHAIAILEQTLGDVEGYQSDDGILEHKCAITAVMDLAKKQREQKPVK